MKNAIENLPQRIRFLREVQGYSQDAIATFLGISQQAYQKMESGKCKICKDRLTKISAFLGVENWQLECLNRKELISIHEKQEDLLNRQKLKQELIQIQSQIDELKERNEWLWQKLK